MSKKKAIALTAAGLAVGVAGFATWLYWPQQPQFDALAAVKNAPEIARSVLAASSQSRTAKAAEVKPQEKQTNETNVQEELTKTPAPKVRSVVRMNFDGATVVENERGELTLISGNGRFAMMGTLVDTWKREEITTAKQASEAGRTIPVEMLGLQPESFNAFTVGKGKERVSIFVDLQCRWCHKLLEEVLADELLLERFAFDFYVVAALGDKSDALSRQFLCADVPSAERVALFKGAPNSFEGLKQREKCSLEPYRKTLSAAQLVGVKGVPFVIAPEGSFTAGKPNNMRKFLLSDKK